MWRENHKKFPKIEQQLSGGAGQQQQQAQVPRLCFLYGHRVTILTDECAIKDQTGDGRDKREGGRHGIDLQGRRDTEHWLLL